MAVTAPERTPRIDVNEDPLAARLLELAGKTYFASKADVKNAKDAARLIEGFASTRSDATTSSVTFCGKNAFLGTRELLSELFSLVPLQKLPEVLRVFPSATRPNCAKATLIVNKDAEVLADLVIEY